MLLAADQYHRVRHFLQSGEHALTAEVCIIEYSMADPRVDAVIEEVLGGDLHMPEREQLVDEAAYQYFSQIREQQGHQLSPEAAEQINAMVVIPQAEKDAILQRTNRVARRVLRPLGYKMLQLQGLDPATADPEAARAALQANLTPQQQAAVDAEAERLFKQVYLPEMQSAMEAAGIDTRDPDAVWQQFGQEVMSRAEPAEEQQSQVGPLSLGIVIGAVVSLAVSSFVGWLKRRRQRRGAEVDEEAELASDSYQDDESAYAE